MNCDQVFMVLTSGPFPSGAATDVAVERHLEQCPSCWRIAEALRPAIDLFQEAVTPAEGRGLPGYWGDALPPLDAPPLKGSPKEDSSLIESEAAAPRMKSLTPAISPSALAPIAQLRAQRRVAHCPAPRVATWSDIGQVMALLVVVASAACSLVWIFG